MDVELDLKEALHLAFLSTPLIDDSTDEHHQVDNPEIKLISSAGNHE